MRLPPPTPPRAPQQAAPGTAAAPVSPAGARPARPTRRALVLVAPPTVLLAAAPPPAAASKAGGAVDGLWTAVTGAGADLYFPESAFGGLFDAESTLTAAAAPRPDALPPATAAALEWARAVDLNATIRYRARFIPPPPGGGAPPGSVVLDRAFNTRNLVAATPGGTPPDAVEWDYRDPNDLTMRFAGGLVARVRVTRRSETAAPGDNPAALETSEFSQVTLDAGGGAPPRVKATRVFTKWRWRGAEEAGGGATVIATQVVAEYLSIYDGDAAFFAQPSDEPVVTYTYRLAMTPVKAAEA